MQYRSSHLQHCLMHTQVANYLPPFKITFLVHLRLEKGCKINFVAEMECNWLIYALLD